MVECNCKSNPLGPPNVGPYELWQYTEHPVSKVTILQLAFSENKNPFES